MAKPTPKKKEPKPKVPEAVVPQPGSSGVDWEAIREEYRAGQLSVREIAARHGITHPPIVRKAKREGWKRDLTKKVRAEVVRRLVTGEGTDGTKASDDEIVAAAADRAIHLIETHRKDIKTLQAAEQAFLAEIQNEPTKLWVGQYQGRVVTQEVGIAVTERAVALQALAGTMHKRITLERQAFGIVDGTRPDEDPISGIIIEPVAGKGTSDE